MIWNEFFPKDRQPTMNDIAEYAGVFKPIWLDLLTYFEAAYKCASRVCRQ